MHVDSEQIRGGDTAKFAHINSVENAEFFGRTAKLARVHQGIKRIISIQG
jgi:hypothetical protein